MPGPPPKPNRIKQLSRSRNVKQGAEPVAVRGLPKCPEHLTGAARGAWTFIAEQLTAMEIDHTVDALALQGACVAYGRAYDADQTVNSLGMTFQTPNGYVQQRPEVSIAERNWKLFKAFCAEFGLTPSGRTRLNITIPNKKPNRFAQLANEALALDESRGVN